MDLILRNVNIKDEQPLMDVAIRDRKIVAIQPNLPDRAKEEIDGEGNVLIPGLVESYIHLDKALIAHRKPNRSGTLGEAISVTAELKPTFTREDIRERAEKALLMLIRNGSTTIRTHAEFDPAAGFTAFEEILGLKERYRDVVDMQLVAFAKEGILKAPGTEEMMHQAIQMGGDVVGGIPDNDTSAEEHIDLVFEMAKKYDKPLDLHQDFKDDAEGISIEYLSRKTIAEGFFGRVSVGHL